MQLRRVVEAGGDSGMVRSEGLLLDSKRSLKERFGIGVTALGVVKQSQIVEAVRDIRMILAEGLLHDCKGTLEEGFSVRVTALVIVKRGQVVEAYTVKPMVFPEFLFSQLDERLGKWGGLSVFPLFIQGLILFVRSIKLRQAEIVWRLLSSPGL
jgi:hypothetical protein